MRPTDYDPAYCARAVEFIAKGHSVEALAGDFGVVKKTIYNWRDSHPDFADAIDEGFSKRQKMVEDLLINAALTGQGSAAATIFLAKNWAGMRDRMEVDSNVKASVEVEDKHDPKLAATVAEFETRLRDLIARKPSASQE